MGMFALVQVMELRGGNSAVAVRRISPRLLIWLEPSTDIFLPFEALYKFVSNNLVLTLKNAMPLLCTDLIYMRYRSRKKLY